MNFILVSVSDNADEKVSVLIEMEKEKVLLAYSGGLDTSCILK
jgi:PP-loop superfamily ATP-utilizing enzyme